MSVEWSSLFLERIGTWKVQTAPGAPPVVNSRLTSKSLVVPDVAWHAIRPSEPTA